MTESRLFHSTSDGFWAKTHLTPKLNMPAL